LRRKVARGKSGAQGIVGLLGFFQGILHCSEQIGADGLMLLPHHGDLPVHIVGIDLVGGWERGLGIVRRISYTGSTSRISIISGSKIRCSRLLDVRVLRH
jgi:hypothetical protein